LDLRDVDNLFMFLSLTRNKLLQGCSTCEGPICQT